MIGDKISTIDAIKTIRNNWPNGRYMLVEALEHMIEISFEKDQLLEYKEKCKELDKENKLLHLELGNVLDERVEEKQDTLLGKALKWASNNNIEFVEGLSNVRYLSVQDHEIEELLNLYKQKL